MTTPDLSHLSGKRKKVVPIRALPLRWPSGNKQRYDLVDTWHDEAMKIVHSAKADFRMMAVVKKVINWNTGTITLTNKGLAARAGACAEKTITRNIHLYADLGIFMVEVEARQIGPDEFMKRRTIRLSVPEGLPMPAALNAGDGLDTRGPSNDDWPESTRGLATMDNRGPGSA